MRTIKFRAWDIEGKKMLKSHEFNYSFLQSGDFRFFKPMQFTGLLDKNGKEIYEGDIIKTDLDPKEFKNPVVVEWHEDVCGWSADGLFCEPEVIGNVYENKDLLK